MLECGKVLKKISSSSFRGAILISVIFSLHKHSRSHFMVECSRLFSDFCVHIYVTYFQKHYTVSHLTFSCNLTGSLIVIYLFNLVYFLVDLICSTR